MEYGMALCRPKDLKIPIKQHRNAIELFASVGKRPCIDVIGLFDDTISPRDRWERLNANFWQQVRHKDENFGIYYALRDFEQMHRPPIASCFSGFAINETVKRWKEREANGIVSLGWQRSWDDMWKYQRQEELLKTTASKYATAYIFLRDRDSRRQFQSCLFSLSREHQRAVILWTLCTRSHGTS